MLSSRPASGGPSSSENLDCDPSRRSSARFYPCAGGDPVDALALGAKLWRPVSRARMNFQLLATGFKRCRNILEGTVTLPTEAAGRLSRARWIAGGSNPPDGRDFSGFARAGWNVAAGPGRWPIALAGRIRRPLRNDRKLRVRIFRPKLSANWGQPSTAYFESGFASMSEDHGTPKKTRTAFIRESAWSFRPLRRFRARWLAGED